MEENRRRKEEDISYKAKLGRHQVLKFYRACIIIILLAIAAVCIFFYWKNKEYVDYEVRQQYAWNKSGEAQCLNLDGYLLVYSKDGMSCVDTKGNTVWNQSYEMQAPIIKICGSVVAAGDYNGRNIYVAGTDGIIGTIHTTMPIRDIAVSENGVVATVLEDSEVTAIYLYNAQKGEPFADFKTTMSKSGYPIAVDVSDDGKLVAVSYLKAEDGEIVSNVGFYNFSSVGQNYTDNLVGVYVYDRAVVPLVEFMSTDAVFCVADDRLMLYEGEQIPTNTKVVMLTEEVLSVYHNEKYVGLVSYNTAGETQDTYRLDIYNIAGDKEKEITFDMEYKEIIFDSKSVIIYNEDECCIYNWDGRLKYAGRFKERIQCILPMGSVSRYTVVTGDSIQLIELN